MLLLKQNTTVSILRFQYLNTTVSFLKLSVLKYDCKFLLTMPKEFRKDYVTKEARRRQAEKHKQEKKERKWNAREERKAAEARWTTLETSEEDENFTKTREEDENYTQNECFRGETVVRKIPKTIESMADYGEATLHLPSDSEDEKWDRFEEVSTLVLSVV